MLKEESETKIQRGVGYRVTDRRGERKKSGIGRDMERERERERKRG